MQWVLFGLFSYALAQTVYFNNPNPAATCGVRNYGGVNSRILGSGKKDNKADFGEFPWQIAVFRDNGRLSYLCGGSLIHPQVVLTVAHWIDKNERYAIRAGDWNTQDEDETFLHQEQTVREVLVHPQYSPGTLLNDIALLILDSPLDLDEHIQPVCLPRQGETVQNTVCISTGWGKDAYGDNGQLQAVLRKIDLPMVPSNTCQERLRTTYLGNSYQLDRGFICAGGELGKDTCTGDGGGPLVCPIFGQVGRYFEAGITSWGIGCGEDQMPAVYVNVALYLDWINAQFDSYGFDKSHYTYN